MRGWGLIAVLAIIAIALWAWRIDQGIGPELDIDYQADETGDMPAPAENETEMSF